MEHSAMSKVFCDPIHGHIEMHPLCVRIIDTPQFQRLRYIKQLGGGYFVYPGASHNRFEHSLGVGYLAGELVRQLQRRQNDELESMDADITDVDVLCVEIAGLCHDLGHGPFSHMFDRQFIPRTKEDGDEDWEHEDASVAMFDELVIKNALKEEFEHNGLNDVDMKFIREQIRGPIKGKNQKKWRYEGRGEHKSFLYEVVANKRNGIDVDKWDYFARDCYYLGLRNSFDHLRFMKFARILPVDGRLQICSREKEVGNLYDMYHTRHMLHRRAYQHKTVKIIEEMIVEALVMANKYLRFRGKDGKHVRLSKTIRDMKAYVQVTDWVYQQILYSDNPHLKKARRLLKRVERRKLYKCVGQSRPNIKSRKLEPNKDEKKIAQRIAKYSREDSQPLTEEHFVVQIVSYDYGKKEKNPMDHFRFYSKDNPDEAFEIRRSEVSRMLPNTFLEQYIRVYSKDLADDRVKLVSDCFKKYCKDHNFAPPKVGTTHPGTMKLSRVEGTNNAKRPRME